MGVYDLEEMKTTQQLLASVSPSFCLAKWLQVTIHLQNGQTHSCHHPSAHTIPLNELKNNPSALHNTKFKKNARKLMLKGERPPECEYCWKIEDASKDNYSDRHLKSNEVWAKPYFEQVKNLPWDGNINPNYMEVSFSNLCNFKCSYCSPHISSKWMEEVKKFGPYLSETSKYNNLDWIEKTGKLPFANGEKNPYVDAFWDWWPEASKKLHMLRLTGGEPLLSQDTFKIFDYLRKNPLPEMEFAINTNLGVSTNIINRLIEEVKFVTLNRLVKKMVLFTSLDTWGKQAEYIRFGLEINQFWRNVNRITEELPNIELGFMCTFNALSVTNFKPFLEAVIEQKKIRARSGGAPIYLDISYLRHPEHLSVKILSKKFIDQVGALTHAMEELSEIELGSNRGFFEFEINKLKRIYEWTQVAENDSWIARNRKDFYLFHKEYDQRKGTNFLTTFPEMSEFWELCRSEAQ